MAMNVSNYQRFYKSLLRNNVGIFAIEYKGYGKLSGEQTSEKSINFDIKNAYEYLANKKNIKPENIIVVGSCVGGFAGVNLAKEKKDIHSLILIAPTVSMNYISDKFIMDKNFREGMPKIIEKLITKNKFFKWIYGKQMNAIDKVKYIKNTNIYVIQSRKDNVTRPGGAVKLAKAAKKNGILKELIMLNHPGHKIDDEKTEITSQLVGKILKEMNTLK